MDGSRIATIGSALADPTRAATIGCLLSGTAHTNGELAKACGVAPSTMSSRLSRLVDAGLVRVNPQAVSATIGFPLARSPTSSSRSTNSNSRRRRLRAGRLPGERSADRKRPSQAGRHVRRRRRRASLRRAIQGSSEAHVSSNVCTSRSERWGVGGTSGPSGRMLVALGDHLAAAQEDDPFVPLVRNLMIPEGHYRGIANFKGIPGGYDS